MILQYLDKDGYEMPESIYPRFVREPSKRCSFVRIARYVRCPQTENLIWIGHCESCRNFKKHVKYKGIECNPIEQRTYGNCK